MTWNLRNYTNQRYYGNTPGKDLRELPVIIVGDNNYGKIEPIVGQAYYRFDYIRMIWPNQDYFDFSTKQILEAIRNPRMRTAWFDIWLNRDFTAYGQVTGKNMSITNWNPSDRMRLYIRKDIANQIWQYGTAPAPAEVVADPYEGGQVNLVADRTIGINGNQPGQFQSPRDVAIAPDGTLYVADSGNHRIQHIALDDQGGFKVLKTWGSFGEGANVPGGIFNEPWGIAVGPDGSVYVADTWNHRIQKFTKDGDFLLAWGYFGQAEKPEAFWGPRDVAVDALGRVFVTDTGNKRVVVFNPDGQYITEFGSYGMAAGQFDENVGIAVDAKERVYVADTWNQRLQVFAEQGQNNFISTNSWDIAGWYGQSLDNKPYVTVDEEGHVLVSDPEGYRVIEFTAEGQFMRFWGDYSTGPDGFGVVNGLAADMHGGVWVCDAGNHRLLHFVLPK
jgi:sugar lactone lactonase YvrE